MNSDAVRLPTAALTRIGRSLVSWWEIPASVMLTRNDHVRFAHAMATSARQLVAAVCALNGVPASWQFDGALAPQGFSRRVAELMSLDDPAACGTIADELVTETLAAMAHAGVPEVGQRLGRWSEGAVEPVMTSDHVLGLAGAVRERAAGLGAVAALVADSWARGLADDASDVDIRLIVSRQPSLDERRQVCAAFAGRGHIRQYGDEAYITADQFTLRGRKVDVKYHTLSRLRGALGEPFRLGGPIDLLELVDTHVVAADPDGVAAELVAYGVANLPDRAQEVARVSARAGLDLARQVPADAPAALIASTLLGPGLEYAIRAWAGLNGRAHAFPKWTHTLADELGRGPHDAWGRLQHLCAGPWGEPHIAGRTAEWRGFVSDLAATVGVS